MEEDEFSWGFELASEYSLGSAFAQLYNDNLGCNDYLGYDFVTQEEAATVALVTLGIL